MAVATTHELTLSPTTVTKTYSRWDQGEPQREWGALTLLHPHRPDLVPRPLACDLGQSAPYVTMSRLAGQPISADTDVTTACLDAVALALAALHSALPLQRLGKLPLRHWGPATALADVREWAEQECAERAGLELDPTVRTALESAAAWVGLAPSSLGDPVDLVYARGDGNVANLLWDGQVVRIVDFEDAGVGDLAFELADTVEHISVWLDAGIDATELLDRLDLARTVHSRVVEYRRMFGVFWLLMLLPGNPAHARNPSGSLDAQAQRLLALL